MLSVYGGKTGWIGSRFFEMYSPGCVLQERGEFKPKTKDILYFVSTTHNYNIHDEGHFCDDVDLNLKYLCQVLEHCKSEDITFNFISSWFVYGKTPDMPATEESPCNPTGFYSITKKCAEDLIKSFCGTFGVKYRILRLCNVLGDDPRASKRKNAVSWMIQQLKEDKPISLYDNGSHKRDFLHVDDVCEAIWVVVNRGELNECYNIGSGQGTTCTEIVYNAIERLQSKSHITNIDPPKFHDQVQTKHFWMDTSKLSKLGWKPRFSNFEIVKKLCL